MPTYNDGVVVSAPSGGNTYNLTVAQEFELSTVPVSNATVPYYGTVEGGDEYFTQVLKSDDWFQANATQKQQALFEATELIDKLAYRGQKTDEDQALEFPRGGDTEVPNDILVAAYNIAIKLLGNFDADLEIGNTVLNRTKFGPTETEYQTNRYTPTHLLAGIPSIKAWHKLLPYLREPESIQVTRVN